MEGRTLLYDPVDGSSATWILKHYTDVLLVDSLDAARRYILVAQLEGTASAFDDLRASVLGQPSQTLQKIRPPRPLTEPPGPHNWTSLGKPPRQAGGTDVNEFVAKLQHFADACHDFGKVDPGDSKDIFEIIERSIYGDTVEFMMPALTRADIADKNRFIQAVTSCTSFKFKIGDTVHFVEKNPMKGRNLESAITPFRKGAPGKLVVNRETEKASVDIFFGKSGRNTKILVLKNIDRLRSTMADYFGDPFATHRARPKFMVDQDMTPWARDKDPHTHLFAWMTGFGHLLVAIDEHFKGAEPLSDIGFDFVFCDATVYDGARVSNLGDSVTYSTASTGAVFYQNAIVDVEFGVAESDAAFLYKVTTADVARNPLAPMSTAESITRVCGRDGYVEDDSGESARVDNSVSTLSRLALNLINKGFDIACPVARKTAGDWGQIEHCRLNNIVFVTSDRLAALYAASRDVPVMLVKHHDYADHKCAQYSFCMFGTDEGRRSLTADPATGGGRLSYFPAIALGAVVVVSALLKAAWC